MKEWEDKMLHFAVKRKRKSAEKGYLTVEAAFWLPGIALFLVLLVTLSSYLYQGCFMMQTAYLAAFRGSRIEAAGQRENYVYQQLEELLEREVLSFSEEEVKVSAGALAVTVSLRKSTPLYGPERGLLVLERTQKALCLDPVDCIRGIRFLKNVDGGDLAQ